MDIKVIDWESGPNLSGWR